MTVSSLNLLPAFTVPSAFSRGSASPKMQALFMASYSLASSYKSNGSRLLRNVPLKSTGSCGIMAMRERRALSPIFETSTPSIVMKPDVRLASQFNPDKGWRKDSLCKSIQGYGDRCLPSTGPAYNTDLLTALNIH